jgi:hypothetical protein
MTYNGWSNRETWLVNLWLGDLLSEYQENGDIVDSSFISEIVEEMVSALLDSNDANGFVTDLFNCAVCEINYDEIAEHYTESVS